MTLTDIPPQLRWSCRRGMLELDVLLGNFLQEAFIHLTGQDQATFVLLLDNNDQDLFNWLTGRSEAPISEQAALVTKVRHHAQNRHKL
jgi:antitoxin CptB